MKNVSRIAAFLFVVGVAFLLTGAALHAQQPNAAIRNLDPVTSGDSIDLYPDVSQEGEGLVFQRRESSGRVFDVFRIGLTATDAEPVPVTRDRFSEENPRWAGETRVVYDSDRIERTRLMSVQNAEGTGAVVQISSGETYDFQADVSPDGLKVVYCSVPERIRLRPPRGGEDRIARFGRARDLPEIKTAPAGGGIAATLTNGVNPVWGPAGERIAFASNIAGNYAVYIINEDGTNLQQMTSFDGDEMEPAWSPDGLYLSFTREHDGNWNIWMVEIATGRPTQLTIDDGFDGGPAWGPDGTIYFHSDRDGDWNIWKMTPTGYQVFIPEPEPVIVEPEPVPDTDGDGYPDDVDMCVNDPEDVDGFEDEDGCPDPDNDNDGVLDGDDRCPRDRETMNLYRDEDGCPDETPIKASMPLYGVQFRSGSTDLLETAFPYLDAFAELMRDDINARIEIRGYTDSDGSDEYNLRISQQRAEAVRNYLILKGIAEHRMTAVGYGEADPVADNSTAEGRVMNRRIEIHRLN